MNLTELHAGMRWRESTPTVSYKFLTLFNRQKNTHNHLDIIYFAPHSERRHENGFSPFAF